MNACPYCGSESATHECGWTKHIAAREAMTPAARAYDIRRADLAVRMKRLPELLAVHAAQAAAQPRNWGYAGDLAEIASMVARVEHFLGFGDRDEEPESANAWCARIEAEHDATSVGNEWDEPKPTKRDYAASARAFAKVHGRTRPRTAR